MIHIDFSENYTCKFSSETQSVHFGASRQQASMHTGVIYTNHTDENGKQQVTSFCSISDDTRHGPSAIWAHITPVLKFVTEKFPEIVRIHFLSDGLTTQYRNRWNLYFFSQLSTFGPFTTGTWNYTESGHGKGAARCGGRHRRITKAFCRSFGCPRKGYTGSTDTLRCSGWTDSHEVVLHYSKWHSIDWITVVKRVSKTRPSHNAFASSRRSSNWTHRNATPQLFLLSSWCFLLSLLTQRWHLYFSEYPFFSCNCSAFMSFIIFLR